MFPVREYHLSSVVRTLTRYFLVLDGDIQQAFVDYAIQVANGLTQGQENGDTVELGEDQR